MEKKIDDEPKGFDEKGAVEKIVTSQHYAHW
jgi:hypothetical protein